MTVSKGETLDIVQRDMDGQKWVSPSAVHRLFLFNLAIIIITCFFNLQGYRAGPEQPAPVGRSTCPGCAS